MENSKFPDLSSLLSPKSIAVVGASEKPSVGSLAISNVRLGGFTGAVYGVHPQYSEVYGFPCFPHLSDIPTPPDCVIVAVRSTLVPEIIQEAIECGCKSAVVYAGGFSEAGEEGRALQAKLRHIAIERNFPICGPNCVGFINFHEGLTAFSARLPAELPVGRVGAVIQSGSLSIGFLHSSRGTGFSYIISTGNEAVTESADFMRHLILDPNTDVIIGFIEGFRNINKLVEVAKLAAEYRKPIIVAKIGSSEMGRNAAATHTGALAGSDLLHEVFFEKYGIIRVSDIDEMLETAQLFLKAPLPSGEGVGALTLSGGMVGLLSDLGENNDVKFPKFSDTTVEKLTKVLPTFRQITNPLDTWGMGSIAENTPDCLEFVAQDPNIAIVSFHLAIPNGISKALSESYMGIANAMVGVAKKYHKPVVFSNTMPIGFDPGILEILNSGGISVLQGARSSLKAIKNFIWFSAFLRNLSQSKVSFEKDHHPEVYNLPTATVLSESQSKLVLKDFGIPITREKLVTSVNLAIQAAKEIGYPLAIKIDSPDILHKTEAKAVKLNIRGEDELTQAYSEVLNNATAFRPDAKITGLLVQEMIHDQYAVEMIAGISFDEQFGYSVMVGMGGIFVEIYRDVAVGLVPIDGNDARRMIDRLKGKSVLNGARGRPKMDQEAIVEVLLHLSDLAESCGGKIQSIDINPLIVLPQGKGAVAVDALIVQRS